MNNSIKRITMTLLVAGATLLPLPAAAPTAQTPEERLLRGVRKELIMMPFLSIFDNLSYRIEDGTVYLYGQVIRPTLKSEAGNRVKSLEGVTRVVNNIEVLPLSPYDDRVRIAVARAVYGQPALNRYALGANPSIRIVVKNGNVTLEGWVSDTGSRDIAFLQANGVPGVFSVTNNLRVEK